MKNKELWKPSKFEISQNKLIPSSLISYSSYRMASFIGLFYTEQIEKHCKGHLLDLGCGSVPMYDYYKSMAESITCADWENSAHDTNHIDVFCDLNDKLPFEDNSFDTIIFSDVFEHLSNPFGALSEIKRILKKDGKLLMNYPFLYGIHEAPYDYCRYTKYRMNTWFEALNLKIITETEYGNLFELFEHAILRLFKTKKGGNYIALLFSKFFIYLHHSKPSKDSLHPYMYGYVIQK